VHVKRYEGVDEVMENPEGWLDARWKEKDELLHRFIERQSFQEPDVSGCVAVCVLLWEVWVVWRAKARGRGMGPARGVTLLP
jgi:hypothetical protein